MKRFAAIGFLALSVMACTSNDNSQKGPTALEISGKLSEYNSESATVITLDHHGMAEEEGVPMPQSVATIINEPHLNLPLLEQSTLIGLDLPMKFLVFQENDTSELQVAYTSAEFIARRHGLESLDLLMEFEEEAQRRIRKLGEIKITQPKLSLVKPNFGMVFLPSEKSFDETVASLKAVVNSQPDTRWFGEIEYHTEAAKDGVTLPRTTLLLFGGPAPGGKAMAQYPHLGLDAFCQKLLVMEDDMGRVQVVYNDIVVFAQLYYGDYNKPQEVINGRLKQTFTAALKAGE